jgi:hypothetical protein
MNVNRMPTGPSPATGRRSGPFAAEIAVALIGFVLIACAIAASREWFDAHFLPSFFVMRATQLRIATVVRFVAAVAGAWLALAGRSRVSRLLMTPRVIRLTVGVALALVCSEVVLRWMPVRPTEWQIALEEPRRVPDPRLGWRNAAAHTGRAAAGGRIVEYAFDRSGYRVRRAGEPVDPGAPTILFVGESVMLGFGLAWSETVPALVAEQLHVQSANAAVNGFGTDQAFLRLEEDLPRFRRPVAIVSLFMTTLVSRNLDDDRPHLTPDLAWAPPSPHGPLTWLARLLVPYESKATIDRGVAMTRAVLREIVRLSRARGAAPLIVVPHFGHEAPVEVALRHRVIDGANLPYVLVELDLAWRLPHNSHPNARAAAAIAGAVAQRLSLILVRPRSVAPQLQ